MLGSEREKQIVESWRTHFVTKFRIRGNERGQALSIERNMPIVQNLRGFRAAGFEPFDDARSFVFLSGQDDNMFANDIAEDGAWNAGGADTAGLQDEQAIRQTLGFIHVMRRQNDSEAFGAQAVD
jgi:hypothetical protein